MISKILSIPIALVAFVFLTGCSDNKPVIKVATSPFNPPMVYKKDGSLAGTDYEIFKAFCEKKGCSAEFKEYDFPVMLHAISNGEADIAFSGISITETRQKTMDFSKPYFENTRHLVSISPQAELIGDLSELKNYRIGYPVGFVYDEFIQTELEPLGYYLLSQIRFYLDYAEVLKDMRAGNLDLVFIDEPTLQLWQSRPDSTAKSVFRFTHEDPWGFAFPKHSPLKNEFNAFLKEIGPTGIQKIIQQTISKSARH